MTAEPTDHQILAELATIARTQTTELLQFGSLAAAHQYLRLYQVWRRHVAKGASVLDWGAGNGHFSYFLQRAGYRTTAFSFMDSDFTRWLPPGEFTFVPGSESEPVKLPFEDASFDAVASIGVLEHVRETGGNEPGSLAELTRVLKPGGRIVCWHFPNQASWIDVFARNVPGKHRHLYRYTRKDIEKLVADAGLQMLETGRYAVLPRNTLHKLLGPARDQRWAADLWDGLDGALGAPLNAIAQNHYFVAQRPRGPVGA